MNKLVFLMLTMFLFGACQNNEGQEVENKAPEVTEVKEFYDNGKLKITGTLVNGKREGEWTSYFENGMLKSRHNYSGGLDNGPTSVYYESGKYMFKGLYNMGKKYDVWVAYTEAGDTAQCLEYDLEGNVVKDYMKK